MDKLLSGRRILVVEDEMLIMMMIEDSLADLGCASVTTATTVIEAIAQINGQEFDAAILDMNLNGEKSVAVADALSAHRVPFVFATGNYNLWDEYRDQAVIRKPFSNEDLVDTLTHLLEH